MNAIEPGTRFIQEFHPTIEHFASAVGNVGVDVISTTALILFFESAADLLIKPYFEDGEVSVGTRVNIEHCAPAHAGQPICVTIVYVQRIGRRISFKVDIAQGDTTIMSGTHERAIVNRNRFEQSHSSAYLNSRPAIDFWFDFHSPWCYFASHQIGELARKNGCSLNWRPVHLANLSIAIDGRRPLEANAPFVRWYMQDQYDTAQLLNLPFSPHSEYPLRPSRALRAALYAAEHHRAEPFVKAVMKGYWADQKDLSSIEWLMTIADSIDLDPSGVEQATQAEHYKNQLAENLQTAISSNIFGLPASVVNNKIFWGNDRLNYLQQYLNNAIRPVQ